MYDGLNVKSTLHNIGINQSTSISLQLAKYEAKIYMTINKIKFTKENDSSIVVKW